MSKSAKEMFEELGYKCIHYSITSDIKWVAYQIDCGLTNTKRKHKYKNISFNKYKDEPTDITINETYKNIRTGKYQYNPLGITSLEAYAINQQCKELGGLDD